MSRVHIRGGPWTNAEDEVLKVALAKYGLRDWERVASMLTKKTAAQCRERWESYLDPRLNLKEAWSPDEEERLVELQSLFPNQWRLISEQLTKSTAARRIRPAWLCEQHYLEIRDAHEYEKKQQQQQQQQRRAEPGEGPEEQTLEEFMRERRQRRVAYQAHEEKTARADTVEGDRYQDEMVMMAVSRLANQDQKKGLRKERERKLEEASFLAKLESNRESIEAGTLSARQEKLMRRALEEDRRHRKRPRRGEDEEGEEEEEEEAEAEEEEEAFQPLDVLEDKAQAGTHKRARTLVVDLTKQQEKITASSPEGGSAAAGVNLRLLDRLAAAPALPAIGDGGGGRGPPPGKVAAEAATTWDALAGPSTAAPNLDDVFATLPALVGGSFPNATAAEARSTPGTAPPRASVEVEPEQLFSIPPPLPGRPSTVEASGAPSKVSLPRGREVEEGEATREEPRGGRGGLSGVVTDGRGTAVDSAYLSKAKELVAAETGRLFIRAARRRRTRGDHGEEEREKKGEGNGNNDDDDDDVEDEDDDEDEHVSLADVTVVKELLERSGGLPSSDGDHGGAVAAAQARAKDYVQLSAALPTRALEADCVEDVGRVNAKLAAMEARVAHVALTCFRDPSDTLVSPYVRSSGYPGQTGGEQLLYVKGLWEGRLRDSIEQATFLAQLRVKELEEMARRLDDAQCTLSALRQKEQRLQALYRERDRQP